MLFGDVQFIYLTINQRRSYLPEMVWLLLWLLPYYRQSVSPVFDLG